MSFLAMSQGRDPGLNADLHDALDLIRQGDTLEARLVLTSYLTTHDKRGIPIAEEVESLLRAGRHCDAEARLDRFLNPKFSSVAASAAAYQEAKK